MITKIRKLQRKSETRKKVKAIKARYKHKPKKKCYKIQKPTIYDDFINNIIKNLY